jgi:hypothetical protein
MTDMSPAAAESMRTDQAIIAETYVHAKKVALLSDPEFSEGNRIGLKQIEAGDVVSYEELRRDFGHH